MKLDLGFELDKPNHNNRVYTTECIRQAIDKKIAEGLGLFIAPEENETDLENLGTRVGDVTGYKIEESRMSIEASITDPKVVSLLDSGTLVKVGPRGFGTLTDTEASDVYLVNDFILTSFDLLSPEHTYIR